MARYTEWCEELEAALAEPFAAELHKTKDRFGTFVSVRHYVERLNELVGVHGWSMDAPVQYRSGNKLGLAVGVTILGVTKWNVGDEMEDHGEPIEYTDERTGEVKEKVVDFGSSSTNSWAQAFKRCCAYGFSMGLYLYDKDRTRAMLSGGRRNGAAKQKQPTRVRTTDKDAADYQLDRIAVLLGTQVVPDEKVAKITERMGNGMTPDEAKGTIMWLERQPVAHTS
jgi:hypothetical protein